MTVPAVFAPAGLELERAADTITLTTEQTRALSARNMPLWWLANLTQRLIYKRRRTRLFFEYYHGDHRLLFASAKYREAFGGLFNEFADNWCRVVIDTLNSRLRVTGFRIDKNTEGDDTAWEFWQANKMDLRSRLGHRGALIGEESAIGVWPGDPYPQMIVMDPAEVTVALGADGVTRLAALRLFTDPNDSQVYANVYLPDAVWKFRAQATTANQLGQLLAEQRREWPNGGAGINAGPMLWVPPSFSEAHGGWQPVAEPDGSWPLPNPMGVVSVVPVINRSRTNGLGESEIRDIVPMQDAVNKTLMDGQINSEFTAFPQRWMVGKVPRDPATGKPTEPFDLAVNRLLFNEDPEGKFGSFPESNNNGLKAWLDMLVGHIAAQSSIPAHYFAGLGSTQFPSGDALRAAEAALTGKSREKAMDFGEADLESIRLAFLCESLRKTASKAARKAALAKAQIPTSECLWADPEYRSESEHSDYLAKMQGLGVPQQLLYEMAGLTPAQIARIPDLLRQQAKFAAELAQLNPTPTSANPNTAVLAAPPGSPVAPEVRGDRVIT